MSEITCSICGEPAVHTFGEPFEIPLTTGTWSRVDVGGMPFSFGGLPVETYVGDVEMFSYAECDSCYKGA